MDPALNSAPNGSLAARPAAGARWLGSLAGKLALAVLLVYGATQLLVRTGFFRARVEAELTRLAGMEMRVGRIRATGSFNLQIRDVIGVSEVAGIEARRMRIRWRLFRPRGEPRLESVRVDGLALTIAPDREGRLQPAFLGSLSQQLFDWTGLPRPEGPGPAAAAPRGVVEKVAAVESKWDRLRGPLVLRGASVRWQDAEGRLLAAVSGLDVEWMSMETSRGERISHLDCRAAELRVTDGPQIRGLHVELVEAGGQRFLVALEAEDWGTLPPPRPPGVEARALLDAMDGAVPSP